MYEDVNSDDYETDAGYAQVPPGPLNPASGLLSGLLGRSGTQVGVHCSCLAATGTTACPV